MLHRELYRHTYEKLGRNMARRPAEERRTVSDGGKESEAGAWLPLGNQWYDRGVPGQLKEEVRRRGRTRQVLTGPRI